MKKKVIIALSVVIVSAIISCAWYYKYNYFDTVTSYIKIEYTPPVEDPFWDTYDIYEMLAYDQFSKPKVEFSLESFEDDSKAYSSVKSAMQNEREKINKRASEIKLEISPYADDIEKKVKVRAYQARLRACNELLNKQTTIISYTHPRKFSNEDFLDDVKDIGFDVDKISKYMKKHNILFKIIPVVLD